MSIDESFESFGVWNSHDAYHCSHNSMNIPKQNLETSNQIGLDQIGLEQNRYHRTGTQYISRTTMMHTIALKVGTE